MILFILAFVLLLTGPSLWVRWVMYRYRINLPSIPGTGAELANHLAKRFEIDGLVIEETGNLQDHFDPSAPAIRLSPDNFNGRSLTAVAVAAHEIGHAIQWSRKETVFRLRTRYVPIARKLQQIGIVLVSLSPILGIITRHPIGIAGPILGGVVAAIAGAATYLIVLPEEWDASFNKALPLLLEGDYISQQQEPAVRRILKAAALTYAASALFSVLAIWRWLPLLLRR